MIHCQRLFNSGYNICCSTNVEPCIIGFTSHFMTLLLGHAQKSKFLESFCSLRLFKLFFYIHLILSLVFAFPFPPFLNFLLQLWTFSWAFQFQFQFKKFRESIVETGNSYHGVGLLPFWLSITAQLQLFWNMSIILYKIKLPFVPWAGDHSTTICWISKSTRV